MGTFLFILAMLMLIVAVIVTWITSVRIIKELYLAIFKREE